MWLSNLLPNFWVSARRPPPSLAAKSLILSLVTVIPIHDSYSMVTALPRRHAIISTDPHWRLPSSPRAPGRPLGNAQRVGAGILVGATDEQVRTLLPLHQRELGPNHTRIQSPSRPRFHSTRQSQSCLFWEFQEGQGQQDRKLAVARHPRRSGSL
jgi:hypothetical protein